MANISQYGLDWMEDDWRAFTGKYERRRKSNKEQIENEKNQKKLRKTRREEY